jgi:septum formation protein
MPPLLLASASPRRRALLAALGLPFTVAAADVDETPLDGEEAQACALRLALAKASVVAARHHEAWVLGADTVVVLDGRMLGKPGSAEEAVHFLRLLRDRRHEVITALALLDAASGELRQAAEVTAVWLRDYGEEEIAAYVASGDPFDKAGGYAIQAGAFRPVRRVVGSETNVIGLPLGRLGWWLAAPPATAPR